MPKRKESKPVIRPYDNMVRIEQIAEERHPGPLGRAADRVHPETGDRS
jgi:hypothetical protein